MKKIRFVCKNILAIGLMAVGLSACVQDEWDTLGQVVEGKPITLTMKLGATMPADVVVSTRAENDSELSNLLLFVYDRDGKFEQVENLAPTKGSTTNSGGTLYSVTFTTTSGRKSLLAVANTTTTAGEGVFWENLGNLVEQAKAGNLDFDALKASVIRLRKELYENNFNPIEIVSSSQMLMSGWNTGVVLGPNGSVQNYGEYGDKENGVVVKVNRSMARITFNIAASGSYKFTPTSYRVYNVPVQGRLTNTDRVPVNETDKDLLYKHFTSANMPPLSDEKFSFTFYMPENIYPEKEGLTYAHRDEWKGSPGALPEKKEWTNAPQTSTFVVISGRYEDETNHVTGNVDYTIHLGEWDKGGTDAGNFSVERNCSYTYNVTVTGVDKIQAEAEKKPDEGFQQGAEGDIYDYSGTNYSYRLDAHYEQVYLEYDLSSIAEAARKAWEEGAADGPETIDEAIADKLIVVIQSEAMDYEHPATADEPYSVHNKRGMLKPYQIYCNADDPDAAKKAKEAIMDGKGDGKSGFDYKWVEFWPQSDRGIASYPGVSSWSREDLSDFANEDAYGGTAQSESKQLMDVYDVVVAMGKVVKKICEEETVDTDDYAEDGITVSKNDNGHYVARFTAFVNEYYYYRHPLTHEKIVNWSLFTNKMPREMIVSMSTDISTDENSTYSTLYSYISQLSIQTFYSSRSQQVDAFGIETYNETPLCKWEVNPDSETHVGSSVTDGRVNQLELIKFTDGTMDWDDYVKRTFNGWTRPVTSAHSSHKLPDDAANPYVKDGDAYAYYACLSRNRDLNGNGKIDGNEVRWYLPALNEYIRISIGTNALSNTSRLYQGDKMAMIEKQYPGEYIEEGALYYTSSGTDQRIYWAVERGSYGKNGGNDIDPSGGKALRCARMLPGTKDGHDITTVEDVPSEPTYKKSTYNNGLTVLQFEGILVDDLYRERVPGTLSKHTEDDAQNRFYRGGILVARNYEEPDNAEFRLGNIVGFDGTYGDIEFDGTMSNPCAGHEEGGFKDWRVPNLVELSALNAAGLAKQNTACCTGFSNPAVRYGFILNDGHITCPGSPKWADHGWDMTVNIRCVRDVSDGHQAPDSGN